MEQFKVYKKLGKKFDTLPSRVPWNDSFYSILKELYTPEEAELIIKMPWGFHNLEKVGDLTKIETGKLKQMLDGMADKGLMMDYYIGGEIRYMIPPLIVGFFEFTMMRVGEDANTGTLAKLYKSYISDEDTFFKANFGKGEEIAALRTVVHEDVLLESDETVIYDYESAKVLIEKQNKFSIGICACRNKKEQLGARECDHPLDACLSFGPLSDFLVRRKMAKEATKEEVLDRLKMARERSLVISVDNIKDKPSYMCLCCKCCCVAIEGITKQGYKNSLVSSNFLPALVDDNCNGCGLCGEICPVEAIIMRIDTSIHERKQFPDVRKKLCIGCGVCALNCKKESLKMVNAEKRVFTPADTFEKAILTSLEKDVLHFQMFPEPGSITHKIMRGFLGGFFRLPPVKKALLSERGRSKFLNRLRKVSAKKNPLFKNKK